MLVAAPYLAIYRHEGATRGLSWHRYAPSQQFRDVLLPAR